MTWGETRLHPRPTGEGSRFADSSTTWGGAEGAITPDRGWQAPRAPGKTVYPYIGDPRGGDGLSARSSLTREGAPREKNSFRGVGIDSPDPPRQAPGIAAEKRMYAFTKARTCLVCGREFNPRTPTARYCPPTEADRKRRKTPRSRCAQRAMNYAQRLREGGETIPLDAPLPEPFDCAQCGEHCVPGENVAPHATKFCGRRCKRRWHYERQVESQGAPA